MMKRIAEMAIAVLTALSRFVPRAWAPFLAEHAVHFAPFAHLIPSGREVLFHAYLGKYSVAIDTKYGIEKGILVDRYEPHLIRFIRDFVPQGGCAVDIGANVGGITLALADQVGQKGRVYAFEPGLPIYKRLARNLNLNPGLGPIVSAYSLGISDAPGDMIYMEYPQYPGDGGLIDIAGTGTGEAIKVPVTTLDLFSIEQGIERIDFIKLDIEGMEHRALMGAKGTLARFRPVLHIETLPTPDGVKGRENFARIRDLLAPFQYKLFRALDSGDLVPSTISDFAIDTFALPPGKNQANAFLPGK